MDEKDLKRMLASILQNQAIPVSNVSPNRDLKILEKMSGVSRNTDNYAGRLAELPVSYQNLPKEFKKAMLALKDLHNTPYEFSLSVLLGMANTCSHHLYDVNSYKYGIRPISMYIMILLGTAGSKSTIYNEVKGPFVDYCSRMRDALSNEDARYVSDYKAYKKLVQQYEKDLEAGIKSKYPDKPVPAETGDYLNGKFTVNGLIDTLKSQPHASLISAEAGEFFSSHAFQGSKQDSTRSTEMTTALTRVWDGDGLSRVIKEERVNVENRRVNSMLMVQEGVIRDVLNNRVFQEQGFTHRILISQIHPFEKPDMSYDPVMLELEQRARDGLKEYLDKLVDLLNIRAQMIEGKHFELRPIVIESTDEAKIYIANYYNSTKRWGDVGGKLEMYSGFANRIHEHLIRIAATLAAFNNRDQVVITMDEARAAVDIMNMFVDHRVNLEMGITDTRAELTQGANVLKVWFKKHSNKTFTKRELSQYGPKSFREITDEQRVSILQELINSETVIVTETIAKNGKKVQQFQYNTETV
jgi:hypothetical protein